MKPEIFQASLERGSNKLYVQSDKQIAVRNGAFIKLGGNDIFYRAESSENVNIKRKFDYSGETLTIKGNYQFKLAKGDLGKISFNEYEAININSIEENEYKYSIGDLFYAQGGNPSSSSGNLTGEYTEFKVTRVKEDGSIDTIEITKPGLYIHPPQNPVEALEESGKRIKLNVEYDVSSQVSIIERDFKSIECSPIETRIGLSYPLERGITEGEFIVSKQVIYLNKAYDSESFETEVCQITFDYSPVNGIPLLPPNSIDPQTSYNEAVAIIDKKLQEMDKRITRMENMNY